MSDSWCDSCAHLLCEPESETYACNLGRDLTGASHCSGWTVSRYWLRRAGWPTTEDGARVLREMGGRKCK